ncbi:YfiR family protein [Paraburkholderia lacunae]|uniref:DUF4154 domain-containing protein n=1 Tax=Paraburkholderia lacunae TaxID=2211104 RepID=A0A370N9W9_9BURK|nr:YfiR family protein [Paraburkholderia lacunae]RDK02411.1 DUF4154 domain-containing protein [Paraburkholderia lacunae]
MRFPRSRRVTSILAFLISALIILSAYAQVDVSALKAAYIFNFTEFTTWPLGSLSDAALVVCANRDTELGAALAKLDGRNKGGRLWSVVPLPTRSGQCRCNVVVLESGAPIPSAVKEVLASDQPVLVVSDFDTGDHTAIIRLFTEDNHLRFDIENQQALHRHLTLSSKLLRLARNVL